MCRSEQRGAAPAPRPLTNGWLPAGLACMVALVAGGAPAGACRMRSTASAPGLCRGKAWQVKTRSKQLSGCSRGVSLLVSRAQGACSAMADLQAVPRQPASPPCARLHPRRAGLRDVQRAAHHCVGADRDEEEAAEDGAAHDDSQKEELPRRACTGGQAAACTVRTVVRVPAPPHHRSRQETGLQATRQPCAEAGVAAGWGAPAGGWAGRGVEAAGWPLWAWSPLPAGASAGLGGLTRSYCPGRASHSATIWL